MDECLGIDPAVEFGGVAEPFHRSLRSSTYLTTLQYRLHAEHFIGGYRHLLQFQFVEGAVQHFAEIVPQSVHEWILGMNLVYREHLFAPIRRVALFELTFVLADAHANRHTQLVTPLPSCPYRRCHTFSWFFALTSDGAIPMLRWGVLLYDRTKS